MSYRSVSPTLIKLITDEFSERKFQNGDATFDFIDSTISYVKENMENGTAGDFVKAMSDALTRYASFTEGQTRGLLNCIRSEVLSADKAADAIVAELAFGIKPLDLRSVPSGNYAVEHDETTAFYVIDNVTNGKWKDWVFVKILASDQELRVGSQRPGQMYQGKHENLLRKIAENPYEASVLFGHKIGRCGICGKTLTDPESIEAGIGPVCAKKVGWSFHDRALLRSLGLGTKVN
jgi:hypothetical protein